MLFSTENIKNKKVCIYCMGEYGMKTYFYLQRNGFPVTCFGDTDDKKRGYALEGIYCYSYDEIKNFNRDQTVIIVSKKNPDNIIKAFKNYGFRFVYSYEDINYAEKSQKIKKEETKILSEKELINLHEKLISVYYNKEVSLEGIFDTEAITLLEDCLRRQESRQSESY